MGRPKLREPINEDYRIFGERLAQLRKDKNLSQAELARELNLGISSIAEYETGTQRIQLSTIKVLSEYFNVTVDYLIGTNITPNFEIKEPVNDDLFKIEQEISKFSEEELEELANYTKFIVSKRK